MEGLAGLMTLLIAKRVKWRRERLETSLVTQLLRLPHILNSWWIRFNATACYYLKYSMGKKRKLTAIEEKKLVRSSLSSSGSSLWLLTAYEDGGDHCRRVD
jgi:hypothetical protein